MIELIDILLIGVLYSVTGALISLIVRNCIGDSFDTDYTSLIIIAWPFLAIGGIGIVLARWLVFPLIGATRSDVRRVERRVDRLYVQATPVTPLPFKVGDRVTGIPGNPGNYDVLYEGCVCRVLSIDAKGSMKLILMQHKDWAAHSNRIGNTYTAPARNFVLIPETVSSRPRVRTPRTSRARPRRR